SVIWLSYSFYSFFYTKLHQHHKTTLFPYTTLFRFMERQCNNALEISQFLQKHQAVECVHYPGLPNHPQHDLASRLLINQRYGGLLAFELKEQTREAAYRFMDRLQLCLPATTLGDVYSEVSYPAMSSHRNLTTGERQKFGITD